MIKINFQPMPKRFMVWDTETKSFCGSRHNELAIYDMDELADFMSIHRTLGDTPMDRFMFCQSTNLFDKDGKEIFEGSIVKGKVFDDPKTRILGVVIYRQQAFWIINTEETHSEPLLKFYEKEIEVLGHILSNPELLEEKDV